MQDEATTIASGIDEVLQETNTSSKKEDNSGGKDNSHDDKKKWSVFFDTGGSFMGRSPAIMFLDPVLSLLTDLSLFERWGRISIDDTAILASGAGRGWCFRLQGGGVMTLVMAAWGRFQGNRSCWRASATHGGRSRGNQHQQQQQRVHKWVILLSVRRMT